MLAYKELKKIFYEQSILSDIDSILQWDLSTFMPERSRKERSKQLCLLSELKHRLFSSERTQKMFQEAKNEKLSFKDAINFNEMLREYEYFTSFNSKFIEKKTKLISVCEGKWRDAKEKKNFNIVKNELTKLVDLIKEEGKILSEKFNCSVYDSLMKHYNYSFNSKEITKIFNDLEKFILKIYPRIKEKQKKECPFKQVPNLSEEMQFQISKFFMKKIGFKFQNGRIDKSLHPFCGGGTDDVRITTRLSKDNPFSSFEAVMHETGHGLYEQGLPVQWKNQPLGKSGDMVLHESQSLFVEMQIMKSKPFLKYFSQMLKDEFNISHEYSSDENLFKHFNRVKKSYIRVDADEVTYPLHIILRFELERKLFQNEFKVKDLPDIWNSNFEKIFGFKVDNDANGCLQDIHWYAGLFGYFPTYTLGAIISSQISWAIKNHIPKYDNLLEKGKFKFIVDWLRENIHSKGRLMLTKEIVKKATKEDVKLEFFKSYLKTKYLN
ncbi:MAG: carboxypeptidase M32 [Rickettsiales bacterium]|nr:carboxypeptidase M32 [Rickettsiales bacterium]